MPKPIALVLFCLATVQLRAEPELKGSPAELTAYLSGVPHLVSIAGEAEVKVPADRALISLKVVTENKSLQEASRANQEVRGRIIHTLAERGLPAERVKPSKFSSTPKYGMFREKAKSYRVENVVKITAQDEKEFQAVSALVDSLPEVRYESVEFEHSDKDGLKKKALTQAIEKASEKKRLYEEQLGVKLTAKRFSESTLIATPVTVRKSYAKLTDSAGRQPAYTGLPSSTEPDTEAEETPSSFSELVFVGRVTVEYAVESK